MIIKYISFLIGIIWSYSIIRTQSIFSKKTGLIFKILITKVSWFTLIATCYFGYKNFSIKFTLIGIVAGIVFVHLVFIALENFLNQKFETKSISFMKATLEYSLVITAICYFFYYFFI
tara:strand:- start:278 stop:631 length:354 start_codon:yes stop_codon:yes gene_type:complete